MKKLPELSPEERRHICEFNFSEGPVEELEGAEEAFLAFGHAAMAWGRLETHIDALLIHLNKRRFSTELFDQIHPVSFSGKLKLLKVWFERHKALSENKHAIDKIVVKLRTLSEARNGFMHALFSAYDQDKKEITIRSLRCKGKDELQIIRRDFGIEKLIQLSVAINMENKSLSLITSVLFTSSAIEQLEKP